MWHVTDGGGESSTKISAHLLLQAGNEGLLKIFSHSLIHSLTHSLTHLISNGGVCRRAFATRGLLTISNIQHIFLHYVFLLAIGFIGHLRLFLFSLLKFLKICSFFI